MLEAILQMSLYGSMAAAVVLLLRCIPILRPNIKFLLWCLVFLRLALPPGLPTPPAAISLQAVVPAQAVAQAMPPRPLAQAMPPAPVGIPATPDTAPAAPQDNAPADYMGILETLWLCGAASCLLLMLLFYIRTLTRPKYETAVSGVYASDYCRTPMVMGIFRPRILLPAAMNPQTAGTILLHERTHIQRGDHITKPLLFTIAAIHWFNPLVWLACRLAVRDMEMAVDDAVLRAAPQDTRKQYASALLSAAQSCSPAFPGFGESDIRRRIKGILNFKKPSRWIAAISLLLVAATGVFLLSGNREKQPQSQSLYAYKSAYVGDNSNTVNLLLRLPYGDMLQKTELRTDAPPYGIVATYDFSMLSSIPEEYESVWSNNSAAIFALIDNVEEIYYNSGANTYYTAYRADFEQQYGQDLRLFAKDEATFDAFYARLAAAPQPAATASPLPSPVQAPPGFITIGADDLMADFTMDMPSDCTANAGTYDFRRNGFYAGYIGLVSYYADMPYDQLMNNHTERIADWEEVTVDFQNSGAWVNGIEKIVVTRFNSDDYDDPRTGRLYDHITYNLIFGEIRTTVNAYTDEEYTYQDCYQLDFTTTYYDVDGSPTTVFTEQEILAMVRSFALKGEQIYRPALSFSEMDKAAGDFLLQELRGGATPEARAMYEAMGKPAAINLRNLPHSYWTRAENGRRVIVWELEKDNMKAQVRMDMDTGKIIGFMISD